MRLLRLKTFERYYALAPFDRRFDQNKENSTSIDPLCLVGVNGSGKSNLIELLSEIFCYLERYTIEFESIPKSDLPFPIAFELEYELSLPRNKTVEVQVVKEPRSKAPRFFTTVQEERNEVVGFDEQFKLLPSRILGYSSGLNETIGFPYLKNQSYYSQEVREEAFEKRSSKEPINQTKSLFLDYDLNAAIVLANYIFTPIKRLKPLEERLRISSVHSFRMEVNWRPKSMTKPVRRTAELEKTVASLKACAVMWSEEGGHKLVLDFIFNAQTKNALKTHFKSGADFLTSIYKLSLLNSLSLSAKERDFYRNDRSETGLIERPPEVSTENKVFRTSRLKLELADSKIPINYSDISDGEHQFILIIGAALLFRDKNALFLLDEPETHYNPAWRTRFINTLNGISQGYDQQFIISTHSPFVVSDCHGESVFQFKRDGDNSSWGPIQDETFGASFDYILTKLFDLRVLISERALEEMKAVVDKGDLDEIEDALSYFGESFEKRFLYQKLTEKQSKAKGKGAKK